MSRAFPECHDRSFPFITAGELYGVALSFLVMGTDKEGAGRLAASGKNEASRTKAGHRHVTVYDAVAGKYWIMSNLLSVELAEH